jgi:hypothetical protein
MFKKFFVVAVFAGLAGTLLFGTVEPSFAMGAIQADSLDRWGPPAGEAGPSGNQGGGSDFDAGVVPSGMGQVRGNRGVSTSNQFTFASGGELSTAEAEALTFMREEEKLAHDVYTVMYEQWGLPIFLNISRSEQAHTDAVKTLLDNYAVPDPASNEFGVFTNQELQALYDDLISQGSQSLTEALRVGAAIEEIDILDLQERLVDTDNADVLRVFNNLLQGSTNHLNAFTSTLASQTGETYQPQFMSTDDLEANLGKAMLNGNQGRTMRGGRQGRP